MLQWLFHYAEPIFVMAGGGEGSQLLVVDINICSVYCYCADVAGFLVFFVFP